MSAPAGGRESSLRERIVRSFVASRTLLLTAAVLLGGMAAFGLADWRACLFAFAAFCLAALAPHGRAARLAGARLRPRRRDVAEDVAVRALVEAMADPALLLDRRRTVVLANGRATRLLDLSGRRSPVSFVLRAPEVLEAVEAAAETGEAQQVRYYERVPLDRWFEAHVAPIDAQGASGGEQGAVLVVLRDLTRAEQLDRMRADFVAHASHELRTPLASLSGFIETLQGPAREDPMARERFLGIMRAQAERMSRLIDDLLSLSRIELDAHVRPETLVDLSEIVRHVADGLRLMAEEERVEFALDLPEDGLTVRGDRDELIRVVENLTENAIKYGAEGGRVEIALASRPGEGGEEAAFAVRDHGPGIAPEHLPRLTERFYRVDAAASRGKGGTGLGLAIVKHIVNRHRGRLEIDSQPGEGATFTVRLPLPR